MEEVQYESIKPLFSADELRRTTALQMAMDICRGTNDLAVIMRSAKEIEAYLKGTEQTSNT